MNGANIFLENLVKLDSTNIAPIGYGRRLMFQRLLVRMDISSHLCVVKFVLFV